MLLVGGWNTRSMKMFLILLLTGLGLAACTQPGNSPEIALEGKDLLSESETLEQNYCSSAVEATYKTSGEDLFGPWEEKNGFNLGFNASNWFKLPDGNLKDVAKSLSFLVRSEDNYQLEVFNHVRAITNICLEIYEIDIQSSQ